MRCFSIHFKTVQRYFGGVSIMNIQLWLLKRKARERLMRCFRLGGIYKEIKTEKRVIKCYPKIHDIHIDLEKVGVRFTFTLFDGTDPNWLLDQKWIFNQVFGRYVEIDGKSKKFIIWVFDSDPSSPFEFDYEEVEKAAKGLRVPIIAGKDSHGHYHVFDMIENPHMLIMGETGSGKSVYQRSIITFLSLYMRDRLELYLADMKRTEFHLFRNVDNVKCAVNDKKELLIYLNKIQAELIRRGNLFDKAEVAHIDEYNAKVKKKLPYMLLCIDEVALLKKEKAHMEIIEQISCIGRALGCLMILSMQRGDAKLLDGQLKNNLTVRSVFRCADSINSDIGLGKGSEYDASKILDTENGKFYFKKGNTILLQAPLLEGEEAKRLLSKYKTSKPIDAEYSVINDDIATLPVIEVDSIEPKR